MSSRSFRAAVVRTPGGPRSIEVVDVPVVHPAPGEVRVIIDAAGINPVDLGVTSGRFHAMGLIGQREWTGIGWDFAGHVIERGEGVDVSVGSRVAGVVLGFDRSFGTYAEEVNVSVDAIAVVPPELDLVRAATVPLNALAASQAVAKLGATAGRLLVTGAAGAVGANATVLAGEAGWAVTGLARPDDESFVRGLGAEFTTEAASPEWDAVIDTAVLGQRGVDLVRDGGTYVGLAPASIPEATREVDVQTVITQLDPDGLAALLAKAAADRLPTRVQATFPLEQAAEAQLRVAAGGVRGRVVLRPSTSANWTRSR